MYDNLYWARARARVLFSFFFFFFPPGVTAAVEPACIQRGSIPSRTSLGGPSMAGTLSGLAAL